MPEEVVELRFGTPKHNEVLKKIMGRFDLSERAMSAKYDYFAQQEESFRAYKPATEADQTRAQKRREGKPQFTTIEVPFSYAILLTMHSFLSGVFLGRTPVMQYSGRHGEGEQNKQAVEAIIDYQVQVGEMLQPLFIWLLDPGRYGFGVLGNFWREDTSIISRIEERTLSIAGIPLPGKTRKVRVVERVPGYQGNSLYNVRPQDFFPDTRQPLGLLQQGEFCGRRVEVTWNTILKAEDDGLYFNIEPLKKTVSQPDHDKDFGSSQNELPNQHNSEVGNFTTLTDKDALKQVSLLEMYIELVPRDWKLGKGTRPEKWVFVVANKKVILHARPFGAHHDKYPFFVLEHEIDGYQLFKRSLFDIMEPLNNTLSWLFNTHVHNVRKAINDQVVYDPSRVTGKDLRTSEPGKLIRIKPAGYGQNIDTMIKQLQVNDVTQTHLKDIPLVVDMMQRVSGVTDDIAGLQRPGRRSATEARQSAGFGVNRLKTLAEWMGPKFGELATVLLQNTQQNYDDNQKFKIVGDNAFFANQKFTDVSPENILGFFDYVPVDANRPIDKFAMTNLWIQMMQAARQMPEVATQYNFPDIFAWVAQLAGLKNIHQFKIQAVPDDVLQNQAQAGNVVPIGEPKEPSTQIPGVGPTG